MIDHTGIGVAHVGRSAVFYDAALHALGLHRVKQIPEDYGADGIGYGVDDPIFWIDRFHPTARSSIRPSLRRAAQKLTPFTRRVFRRVEPITVRRGFAIPSKATRKVTTQPSYSIRTVII